MAITNNPTASSPPAWILLDTQVSIGNASHRNGSTAMAARINGRPMEVSVWPLSPPFPSRMYVHCPNLEPGEVFIQQPSVVSTAGGFVLLRIGVGCLPSSSFSICSRSARIRGELMIDYFVYRLAGPGGLPSLRRLEMPRRHFFQNYEVALLPRGDHFTVAALSRRTGNEFDLHFCRSEDGSWDTEVVVLLQEPLPEKTRRHFEHVTTTAITIGGERGTVGWVDLWHGVLLCDLLTENRNLRYVPMPLPRQVHGDLGCPKPYRDIAVVGGSLKVVDLDVHGDRLPENDPETGWPNLRIHDWTLTTFTKNETADSWLDDWVVDSTVRASDIKVTETQRAVLLRCGRLCKPQDGEAADQRKLQNFYTCQPVLGLDGKGIVYLLARLKFMHHHAWILAVDTRNNCVQEMVKIGTERGKDLLLAYCASTISSYMNETMAETKLANLAK